MAPSNIRPIDDTCHVICDDFKLETLSTELFYVRVNLLKLFHFCNSLILPRQTYFFSTIQRNIAILCFINVEP